MRNFLSTVRSFFRGQRGRPLSAIADTSGARTERNIFRVLVALPRPGRLDSRRFLLFITFVSFATPMFAQLSTPASNRVIARLNEVGAGVNAIVEQLANERDRIEKDEKLLQHLSEAERALLDAAQPAAALQKAIDEVQDAERLNSADYTVRDGIITVRQDLAAASRSPSVADFDALRRRIRDDAIAPAARVVARNIFRLDEETLAWLKIQETIVQELRTLATLSNHGLQVIAR